MIVGATVAQAELEHGPWQIDNPGDREVEAGTLRLKPTDEAVETTHTASFWQMTKDCRPRSKGQQGPRKARPPA
jgi:hypothetical protein